AWPLLGERLNLRAGIALMLCVGGLLTLVYPAAAAHSTAGLVLALGCALSWAAGTIYMKWAKIPGGLLTVTAWQIALGAGGCALWSWVWDCRASRACRCRHRCRCARCWPSSTTA